MARILVEGFETGDCSQWDYYTCQSPGTSMDVVTSQHRSGSYSIYNYTLYYSYWTKNLNLPSGIIYGSFWHRWEYYTTGWGSDSFFPICDLITFLGPSAPQAAISFSNAHGTINVMRGDVFGTLLGNSVEYIYTFNTWHFIQFKIVIHPTAGIFQVWLDGLPTPVVDFSGINTQGDSSSVKISGVNLGYRTRTNDTTKSWWDDLVLDDSTLPGNSRIIRLPLSGAGSSTQWIPSTGTNWQCVDEVPYNDADYVSSIILGMDDLYTTSGFAPGVTCNIKSVLSLTRGWKEGGSSSLVTLPLLRAGLTVYAGTTILLGYSSKSSTQIRETNPSTGTWFTSDDIGNLQFGIELD